MLAGDLPRACLGLAATAPSGWGPPSCLENHECPLPQNDHRFLQRNSHLRHYDLEQEFRCFLSRRTTRNAPQSLS